MEKLPKYTHENGIDYVLVVDYYIPMLTLPEENRPIGRWGADAPEVFKREPPRILQQLDSYRKIMDISC